jgi:hypothetical protein
MRRLLTIARVALVVAAVGMVCASIAAAAETASFVGVWKGTSACQVKDSACHDEGAVYTVKKGAAPDSYELSGNKVVGGQETFMGVLQCKVGTESDTLVCRGGDAMVWMWKLKGDSMNGTLTYQGTLFRKISLTRSK